MAEETDNKEPTLDGKRLGMRDLNMGVEIGPGRLKRFFRNLSEFLAGMYTGESCAGTPHSERKSKSESSAPPKSDL